MFSDMLDRWHKPLVFLFWASVLFSMTLAVLPQPPSLPGAPSDKTQHIMAFAAMTALGSLAYRQREPLRLIFGLVLLGAAIEIVQMYPPLQRDADVVDWVADCAAILVTFVVLKLLLYRWKSGAAQARSKKFDH